MVEIEVPSRPSTPRTRSHHASHSPSSDTETPHEITTAFLSEKTTPTTTSSNFFLANDSVNRKTFDFNHLSLPTVTVLSEEAKERRKRKQQRRLCTMSCFFRLFVLFVPFIYMKQISQFLRYIPQAMVPIPRIRQDYSNIHSIYDLSTDNVRPWCFRGGTDCTCQDPLIPVPGGVATTPWMTDHLQNQHLTQSEKAIGVDVVFYGDSIIHKWRDRSHSKTSDSATSISSSNMEVFNSQFSKQGGGKYNGLALGIDGDTSPFLLWRLKNGELPSNLNPRVFWILIGTNDIGRTWCSIELVVIGILRNVEEILIRKPNAQVVINSLLPRSYHKDGYVARGGTMKPSVWADILYINSELQHYAVYRDRVTYVDTTFLFIKQDANSTLSAMDLQIDPDLMNDFLHPTAKGYQIWGKEIIHTLDKILKS